MKTALWQVAFICCLSFFNPPKKTHEIVPIYVNIHTVILTPVEQDIILQAKLISSEARGEPFSGKLGVGEVVVNRLDTLTLADIIFEPSQFNGANHPSFKNNPDIHCYLASVLSLSGSKMLSDSVKYFINRSIATDTSWLLKRRKIGIIGQHTFYK